MKTINLYSLFGALLMAILFMPGCDDDPIEVETGTFVLQINGKVGNERLVIGDEYVNFQGLRYKPELIRFYLSNITLVRADGSEEVVEDVAFIRMSDNHCQGCGTAQGERVVVEATAGTYTSVKIGIGLDSTLNASDPSTFPSSDPLSAFRDMFWTWNTGYIFTKFEGRFDSLPAGSGPSYLNSFLIHAGTNPLYRSTTFEGNPITIEANSETVYDMDLDVAEFFFASGDTINLETESISHTTGSAVNFRLAEKLTDNFTASFSGQ